MLKIKIFKIWKIKKTFFFSFLFINSMELAFYLVFFNFFVILSLLNEKLKKFGFLNIWWYSNLFSIFKNFLLIFEVSLISEKNLFLRIFFECFVKIENLIKFIIFLIQKFFEKFFFQIFSMSASFLSVHYVHMCFLRKMF